MFSMGNIWKKPVRSVVWYLVWYPSYPFRMIHDASWILSYSVLFHIDSILSPPQRGFALDPTDHSDRRL